MIRKQRYRNDCFIIIIIIIIKTLSYVSRLNKLGLKFGTTTSTQ